jgi:ribonuclease HII
MTPAEAARKRRLARERERRRLVRLHSYERAARVRGFELVGGIDEVGRGPLAGPVVAACVVAAEPLMLRGLDDSKKVPAELRESLAVEIRASVVAWAIGAASVEEIERYNIYWASILAMERAIAALSTPPAYLLTDAVRIKAFEGEQLPVIKGDAKCATVAAQRCTGMASWSNSTGSIRSTVSPNIRDMPRRAISPRLPNTAPANITGASSCACATR